MKLSGSAVIALIQTDPALVTSLQRIAWAQIAIATMMVLAFLGVLGAALYSIRLLRTVRSSVQPFMDKANGIAADATEAAASVRGQIDEAVETIAELNERLREAAHAAELRVREFGAVLDAVQGEAENALLDTAATARGVQVAAQKLREPKDPRRQQPAVPPTHPAAGELTAPATSTEHGG